MLPSLALFGGLHLDPDYALPGAEDTYSNSLRPFHLFKDPSV